MFATLTMLTFFVSFLVLFIADTIGIDRYVKCGDCVLKSMFNVTMSLLLVYFLSVVFTLFGLIE